MQRERKVISFFLYNLIISSSTIIIFVVIGVITIALLSLTIKLDKIAVSIIIILLLWKVVIVSFVTWLIHKQARFDKGFAVKFIGLYYGRLFGLIIGGILGARLADLMGLADLIGIILGAYSLYFVGRWLGSKISLIIGSQLDKVVSITEKQGQEVIIVTPQKRIFLVLYAVALPLLFIAIALLLDYLDIASGYFVEWLSIGRIIVIALSIFSIGFPWLMKKRWVMKIQSSIPSPEFIIYSIGLTFSLVPVIYGFILFIAMGASIIELCFFAVTSSIAAIVWSVNTPLIAQKAD